MRRHKVAPTTAGRSRLARPSAGPESGTKGVRASGVFVPEAILSNGTGHSHGPLTVADGGGKLRFETKNSPAAGGGGGA
mgnify:CR=1 FL=1